MFNILDFNMQVLRIWNIFIRNTWIFKRSHTLFSQFLLEEISALMPYQPSLRLHTVMQLIDLINPVNEYTPMYTHANIIFWGQKVAQIE